MINSPEMDSEQRGSQSDGFIIAHYRAVLENIESLFDNQYNYNFFRRPSEVQAEMSRKDIKFISKTDSFAMLKICNTLSKDQTC